MRVRKPIRRRPNFRPETINPVRPGMQQPGGLPRDPNMFSTTPPRPGMFPSTIVNPIRQPGLQLGTQPGFTIPPSNVGPNEPGIMPRDSGYGSGPIETPGSSIFGPRGPRGTPGPQVDPNMQGVGDPRTGAAFIPGNRMQEMMRGTQQAAPVQPVAAMKKGGVVRGGRAEIKGTRPAKLY